jgi:hypothetical protein
MADTFDSVTLHVREVRDFKTDVYGNLSVTLLCRITSWTDYTNIVAKAGYATATVVLAGTTNVQYLGGAMGSLVLNGTTYTNCVISEGPTLSEVAAPSNVVWDLVVSFVRKTTS